MPLIACLPILIILFLMIGFHWSAVRAGAAGYLAAFFIAILFFGGDVFVLAYAHAKGVILSLDVLAIIWMAYLLYRVTAEAGAIHIIGKTLPGLSQDKGLQALLIGWGFASFLQGAGGFGVPVAVTAPLLASLGFSPLQAVLIPSIGHGWAVTFGSLGSSFNALISVTGLEASSLAPPSALFLWIACILSGPLLLHAAIGWGGVRRLLVPALVIGVVMGGVQYIVAAMLGLWNIAAFAGGLAGFILIIVIASWKQKGPGLDKAARQSLFEAISAYFVLTIFTICILLVPPIREWMGDLTIQIPFPETSTRLGFTSPAGTNRPIHVFTHTSAILLYSTFVSYWVYWQKGYYQPGAIKKIVNTTAKGVISSSLGITLMVIMSSIMQQSGMTEALAQGLADAVGKAFPLAAPWIGAIGAFMTGSNTNSNVVFAGLQMRTAQLLGYVDSPILAGQTGGAGLASAAAPAKVIVGTSTADMVGKEGEVLRALISYTAILVLLTSVLTSFAILLKK